jgi:pyruvate,water dikinase
MTRKNNKTSRARPLVMPFARLDLRQVAQVGGKNASLGEMYRKLRPRGIPIPDGFATTAEAYWRFIDGASLRKPIAAALKGLDIRDIKDLEQRGARVRSMVLDADLPKDLEAQVVRAYEKLCGGRGLCEVAVRSSATAEDLPGASFAGQQESFLNIKGREALLDAVKRCIASLFTNRAIVYRVEQGFDHMKVALSVGVQRMVRSDVASAGVMFTLDTESGFRDVVLINGAWGLGESVVQGKVTPDQYYIHKPTLAQGFRPIIGRRIGSKETKIVYSLEGTSPTKTVPVPAADRDRACLTDDEVLKLARWGVEIEKYYSKLAKEDRPMDIEWAKDGKTGELFVVQARPETVQARKDLDVIVEYELGKKSKILAEGLSIGSKIASGKVHVIKSAAEMSAFKDGEILVAEMTDPDWVPIMKRAAAIVTASGGRTCHAAIVSRELGTPAVVGAGDAVGKLKTGQEVTVSCAEGETGRVYQGKLPFEIHKLKLKGLKPTKTRIMLNLAVPEQAFEFSFLPQSGVGLARTEFIFTDYIKVHPLALMNFKKLEDEDLKSKIEELTVGYRDKSRYFVDRLAEGIGMLGAAFYPHEVIVRASDFKTNEYAKLLGGEAHEPQESNPMIGWRGASRYYDGEYAKAFALECVAIRKVREEMGLKNVVVMIPFCRTPEEGKKVLAAMVKAGLKRGKDGLKVFVMVEIPSNIILADKFADLFDGFSIGSNDLTQLTLGVDRDSALVSHLYDELSPAVLQSLAHVIKVAKKKRIKVGICGQAPSDFPEFTEFLVRQGIDSISLNPDSVLKMARRVAQVEGKMQGKKI